MAEEQILSENCCFLCGTRLTEASRSAEHVFPKWLLREANLWDATAFQLNGSLSPYRQCTIPCCIACNSGPLATLESEVQSAFRDGAHGVRLLHRERLSLWMAKVYYASLRRMTLLPADRANPQSSPIIPPDVMSCLTMLHFFLQRIRIPHEFAFETDSTFIFSVHRNEDPSRNFDWMGATLIGKPDTPRFVPALALRHNGVGIITLFGDGGSQQRFQSAAYADFADVPLHRFQFLELACFAFYTHSLFRDEILYSTGKLDGGPFVTTALFPSEGPIWNEFSTEEYAMYLCRWLKERSHPGINSISDVYFGGNAVITYLRWPDGTVRIAADDELT